MIKKIIKLFIAIALLILCGKLTAQTSLVWNTLGKDFHDAIPLGNGDIGISAWAEEGGDLLFYLSKTDAYDDNNRLLKLGRLSIKISPNPFAAGRTFRQELNLKQGEMNISAGSGEEMITLRIWVDTYNPVVRVDLSGKKDFTVRVRLENWRRQQHYITDTAFSDPFSNSIDGSISTIPAIQYPDSILHNQADRIVWYHHNVHSCWPEILRLQGLDVIAGMQADPLQDRIFGGSISGPGLVRKDDTTLISAKPVRRLQLCVSAVTSHQATSKTWLSTIDAMGKSIEKQNHGQLLIRHHVWWNNFWNRSGIVIKTQGDTGATISRSYALQRWILACGGRGAAWTKFNGSIFTLPWERTDPDYRRWGSANWFQNARLPYWPTIAAGDVDILAPFFGSYLAALPLAEGRTQKYYGHGGAFFSETSYSWGTYTSGDYGYDRTDKQDGFAVNTYIRHYWSGGLELSVMMLDEYAITQNKKFLTDTLLPITGAVVRFYDEHWKRGSNGKIRLDTSQSLETWQTAVNPLPDIAGLNFVLHGLLELPTGLTSPAQRAAWTRTLDDLPLTPAQTRNDSVFLMPADSFGAKSNVENPELYAVFPYRLYTVGKPTLQTGVNTFAAREFRENRCWWQDELQAACLGLAHEAANGLAKRMSQWNKDFRFPAMWGPNNDEIPDLDHGGEGQMALQYMLLQPDKSRILLFPAWPKSWDVIFKLHAPLGTTISGELHDGKLKNLLVLPESRRKDIVIMPLQ